MRKTGLLVLFVLVASTGCNEEELLKKISELQKQNELLNLSKHEEGSHCKGSEPQGPTKELQDPLDTFKSFSAIFIKHLSPDGLFKEQTKDDVDAFQKKLSTLAKFKKLIAEPETRHMTLPMDLVFYAAPKPKTGFNVFVAGVHADKEKDARFLLVTSDKSKLENELRENEVKPPVIHTFAVPKEFPILYLGNDIFMLPKEVRLPDIANKNDSHQLRFDYDFENTNDPVLGFKKYLEDIERRNETIRQAKS